MQYFLCKIGGEDCQHNERIIFRNVQVQSIYRIKWFTAFSFLNVVLLSPVRWQDYERAMKVGDIVQCSSALASAREGG